MYMSYICNMLGLILRGLHVVCAGCSGAPTAVSLPGAQCCGVDAALRWHPAGFLLPPLHPALQKQQVDYKMKYIRKH